MLNTQHYCNYVFFEYDLLLIALLFGPQKTGLTTTTTTVAPQRDEIYIDDQGIEGSGGHGEVS